MADRIRIIAAALLTGVALVFTASHADAQSARRDLVGELLRKDPTHIAGAETQPAENAVPPANRGTPANADTTFKDPPSDPRDGDAQFEQAKALMAAVDAILKDSADSRTDAAKLPSKDDFILPPFWRETREDREQKVRDLLDAALAVVTDVPVVDVQRKVEGMRKNIRDLEDQSAKLKEKQLTAPKDATLPGILNDTVASLETAIAENAKRIEAKRAQIAAAKAEIAAALEGCRRRASKPIRSICYSIACFRAILSASSQCSMPPR